MKNKKDLVKKRNIFATTQSAPNMTFKHPKNFAWLKPHKIFESPSYWLGDITQA